MAAAYGPRPHQRPGGQYRSYAAASPFYPMLHRVNPQRAICGRSSSFTRSNAASATARSCSASPVESKTVMSAG